MIWPKIRMKKSASKPTELKLTTIEQKVNRRFLVTPKKIALQDLAYITYIASMHNYI